MTINPVLDAREVHKLSELNEDIKAAQRKLWIEMCVLLEPGRKVFFKHGPHLQQGEIISVGEFWWYPEVYVRNIKTLKERRISLYDVLIAYEQGEPKLLEGKE